MFTDAQKAALDAPLNRADVKTREQAGRSLSYVEGWFVISEANRIFGFDGWTSETLEIKMVSERERKIGKQQKDGWAVSYIAKVRVRVGDVVRDGVGSGHGIDVDLGLAHESAIKEAETDARKRSLMTFGNPFGLALYDKTQSNVVDEKAIEEETVRLREADHALEAASMLGTVSLVDVWKRLPAQTREAFGGSCPVRFKEIAAKHDERNAA